MDFTSTRRDKTDPPPRPQIGFKSRGSTRPFGGRAPTLDVQSILEYFGIIFLDVGDMLGSFKIVDCEVLK